MIVSKRKHNSSDIFYTDCDIGYYGYFRLCKMCPYPSFGTDCQYICDCQNETCNHITGCQDHISIEGTLICHGRKLFLILSSISLIEH